MSSDSCSSGQVMSTTLFLHCSVSRSWLFIRSIGLKATGSHISWGYGQLGRHLSIGDVLTISVSSVVVAASVLPIRVWVMLLLQHQYLPSECEFCCGCSTSTYCRSASYAVVAAPVPKRPPGLSALKVSVFRCWYRSHSGCLPAVVACSH